MGNGKWEMALVKNTHRLGMTIVLLQGKAVAKNLHFHAEYYYLYMKEGPIITHKSIFTFIAYMLYKNVPLKFKVQTWFPFATRSAHEHLRVVTLSAHEVLRLCSVAIKLCSPPPHPQH